MSPLLLLPITLATAGALGLIGLILAFRVSMGRGKHKVYMGDGGNVGKRSCHDRRVSRAAPLCLSSLLLRANMPQFMHRTPKRLLIRSHTSAYETVEAGYL